MKLSRKLLALLLTLSLILGDNVATLATTLDILEDGSNADYEISVDEDLLADEALLIDESSEECIENDTETALLNESDDIYDSKGSDTDVLDDGSASVDTENEATELNNSVSSNEIDDSSAYISKEEQQTLSENDVTDIPDKDDYEDMFPELDELHPLTAAMLKDKEELKEHLDDNIGSVPNEDFVDDEIIVEAANEEEALVYAKAFGGKLINYNYGFALIELNADSSMEEVSVMEAVAASADYSIQLPAAWPNVIQHVFESDEASCVLYDNEEDIEELGYTGTENVQAYNDPFLSSSNNGYQYQHTLMDSYAAWYNGYTGSGIKLAIVDTGIAAHNDLSVKAHVKSLNSSLAVAASGTDTNGHGTHCAGIAGATKNNNKGGCGISPDVTLYDVKVSTDGTMKAYDVVQGIYYAIDTWGVDVISCSFGGIYYNEPEKMAIDYAYSKGAAVFCASGNDGFDVCNYPAAYPHAISVGCVNSANKRTYFSNYHSTVRYTGPGYSIYSTSKNGSSSYEAKSGTSMSTPAIAGAAAVILSTRKVKGSGKTKVNNLLKIMDKGAVSGGSGCGKGTVNLAKALSLTSTLSAPKTPTAVLGVAQPICFINAPVTIYSQAATTVYYTLDGKKFSVKNGTVVSDGTVKTLSFANANSQSLTIKATAKTMTLRMVAVSDITGLASKVKSYTLKFAPKITNVSLAQSNIKSSVIYKGTSVVIEPIIEPAIVANKKFTYSITDSPKGIKIDKNGKLTVAKDVAVSSFTLAVSTTDGSNITATKTYTLKDAPATNIKSIKAGKKSVTVNRGAATDVTLNITDLSGNSKDASALSFSVRDTTVASFSTKGNTLTIKGLAVGSTTVYGYAKDGSTQSISIKVTVKPTVQNIEISGNNRVAQGKSVALKATVTPSNAVNKSLKWSISADPSSGVTIDSKGKVKASKNAVTGIYSVLCTTKDNLVYRTYSIKVIKPSELVSNLTVSKKTIELSKVPYYTEHSSDSFNYNGNNITGDENIAVTVSNPELVSIKRNVNSISVTATGVGTGTSVITVSSTDGSNQKATCKVTINNPVTKMYLSPSSGDSQYLASGCSMKLVPTFIGDYGSISESSKKVTYSSSNPELISVDNNGVIKNVSKKGSNTYVTIYAVQKGTGNAKASITIIPVGYTKKIKTNYSNAQLTLTSVGRNADDYLVANYRISVNKAGLSCASTNAGGVYKLSAYKKGTYTLKITKDDKSKASTTVEITVK